VPRKKTPSTVKEITVTNKRKHEARLSSAISVPSLGKVDITSDEYAAIIADNKHVRRAVNKRFLIITKKGK